jgi:predicted nucleotide-binding protein
MDEIKQNAYQVLDAVLKPGAAAFANADKLQEMTGLDYDKLNDAVDYLEDRGAVSPLRGGEHYAPGATLRFAAINVTTPRGRMLYRELSEEISRESAPERQPTTMISIAPATPTVDPRKVFVVHGRNKLARNGMFSFLRSIGLEPMEWDDMVSNLGTPSPYIGQVLDYAFSHAQAIVVLMTPDEDAQLAPMFHESRDAAQDKGPASQARPNVIFEAGMAMGRSEDHTVIVEVGDIRAFSDLAGRLVIRLDNSTATRQRLANRLKSAGCPVNLNGTDWHTEGEFSESIWQRDPINSAVALSGTTAELSAHYVAGPPNRVVEAYRRDVEPYTGIRPRQGDL